MTTKHGNENFFEKAFSSFIDNYNNLFNVKLNLTIEFCERLIIHH